MTEVFSIAYGVIVGILAYTIINGFVWIVRRVTDGRISPLNYDTSEPWGVPPASGYIIPPWM